MVRPLHQACCQYRSHQCHPVGLMPMPTASPSYGSTALPSMDPVPKPSALPTLVPMPAPTGSPSYSPTSSPSMLPAPKLSELPTRVRCQCQLRRHLTVPSHHQALPSGVPTPLPTLTPSYFPTESPTLEPTSFPTVFELCYEDCTDCGEWLAGTCAKVATPLLRLA